MKKNRKTREIIGFLIDLWNGYAERPACSATRVGMICALVRFRSFPEFVFWDRRGKPKGNRRRGSSVRRRCAGGSSPRVHFAAAYPSEFPLMEWLLGKPSGSSSDRTHGEIRVFSSRLRDFLVDEMGYLPDTEKIRWPNNADNVNLHESLRELCRRTDEWALRKGAVSAYDAACDMAGPGWERIRRIPGLAAPRRLPRGPRVNNGVVYFMRGRNLRRGKVGFSSCVDKRRSTLQSSLGVRITICAKRPGTPFLERHLKRYMDEDNVMGEWFRLQRFNQVAQSWG